jgi:phenylalanine-4-hydroxylase
MKKQFNIDLCIPKINDLSDCLNKSTGFQIKPVPGIISQGSFLNCLAFKVFCSSQFIGHLLTENFVPEPDLIHDCIGHIPMFANK